MTTLYAGIASVDMTPGAVGLPIGGNMRTDKIARGVHDPLMATVLVLGTAQVAQLALVSLDLVALSDRLVARLSRAIESALGNQIEVVPGATHTHSAPDVAHGYGYDAADYTDVDTWADHVADALGSVASGAWASRVQVSARIGEAPVPDVAFNRRLMMPDGSTRMNWDRSPDTPQGIPLGPTDDRMTTVAFESADGGLIAILVHFTLHPAILVGHEWQISADYVGPMRAAIRSRTGAPVLFLNGAMGNINHIDHRQGLRPTGFEDAQRIGEAIAHAADRAAQASRTLVPATPVVARRTIDVQQRVLASGELEAATDVLQCSTPADEDAIDGITPIGYARWALQRGQHLTDSLAVPATVVRLGDLVLVHLPFEVFCEFGLWLQSRFAPRHVLTVSLSGAASLGYLPTAAAFVEGGYEPTLGSSTIEPGAGEVIAHAIATCIAEMLHDEQAG